jgi:uncharacterized Tic20 family protein
MEENTRSEDNNWAGGVHVAAFVLAVFTSWSAGIGGMVAAFVVWLMKKDESAFIRGHAAEAFNFNFSMFIYALVSVILLFMTLGLGIFFLLPIGLVLAIVWLWCTVQAAIAGFDGRQYRYPISFRIMH